MLDLNEMAGVREEEEEGRMIKRNNIVGSAIGAVLALSRQNTKANLAPVISALEQITTADKETLKKAYISRQVVSDAKLALGLLKAKN